MRLFRESLLHPVMSFFSFGLYVIGIFCDAYRVSQSFCALVDLGGGIFGFICLSLHLLPHPHPPRAPNHHHFPLFLSGPLFCMMQRPQSSEFFEANDEFRPFGTKMESERAILQR